VEQDEEKLLRSVALQNARAVLLARERAERGLRESNERVVNILESITDAFITLDKEWQFTYVNTQAEEIGRPLQKTRANLLGKKCWDEFPDMLGTAVESNFRRAVAEQVKVEFEFFYPPLNAWFEVRAYPSRNGLSVYFLNITSEKRAADVRKEAEIKLRSSEEELRALADSISQLAWMAHPNGDIFWYNRRWYEYTGTTLEQMQGWGWKELHDPKMLPLVMERWTESLRTETAFEMEFPLRGADGVYRWFLTRVSPFRNHEGRLTRWFGTNTQIDEQRQLLESLSEARDYLEQRVQERTAELKTANESLRDLSARLLLVQDDERRRLARELHDSVGQLLAAIGMNIAVVQAQSNKLDARGARAVSENAQLIEQVSREIRTISHLLHPPLLEIAGLASALRWYVDGFAERSQIKVDLDIPNDFTRLPNDTELAIFRIVQECLTNIHRHSGSDTASIFVRQEKGRLIIQVRDDGQGIPEEKRRELTETNRSGIGFGGMRERVRQLGGTLEVQSNGSGTTVKAVLQLGQREVIA
jgi:PAS domain S-box-containing protein